MILLIVALFFLIALLDLPFLIKRKMKRELVVYSITYLGVFALSLLLTLGIRPPSPIRGMLFLIRDVLHLAYPA